MRVLLTTEARFERTPDGELWGAAPYGGSAWTRYLEVFSAVLVAARIADAQEPSPGSVRASRPGIDFCALPPYSGARGLVQSGRVVTAAIARAIRSCPAVVVRSPSAVAFLIARQMVGTDRPYGVQIVGDPDQVFSAGAFHHPLRIAFRAAATSAQKYVARHACAAMFVTQQALQRKYPTGGLPFSGSDVELDEPAFAERPSGCGDSEVFTLVTIAALDQPYKGIAVLLEALNKLRQENRAVRLIVGGDGRLMATLQARAQSLAVRSDVTFLGQLDWNGVRRALDSADLFVLPSLTEGLPRALLEAMARGLPAVATNVGGIPELLPPDCLVPPRDAAALARRIDELMRDGARRDVLGQRNRQVACGYHTHVQSDVRREFLRAVRDLSATQRREAVCA